MATPLSSTAYPNLRYGHTLDAERNYPLRWLPRRIPLPNGPLPTGSRHGRRILSIGFDPRKSRFLLREWRPRPLQRDPGGIRRALVPARAGHGDEDDALYA